MKTVRLTKDSQRDLLDSLLKRSPNNYGQYESVVADIIANVREKGDEAVFDYTSQFDKWNCNADNIRVTDAEIEKAYAEADAAFVAVMEKSAANIRDFHQKQLRNSWIDTRPDGSILGQRILPIAVSGVYVPGGKAAYPSSVLMNVIPAKVAGVERIVMTTPAGAIFLGEYSSEPLGDYYAGPNHILPTNGTARFFSPLNVDDFTKKTSLISYSREALEQAHKDIELFAEKEGLTAHANSVRVRFQNAKSNSKDVPS